MEEKIKDGKEKEKEKKEEKREPHVSHQNQNEHMESCTEVKWQNNGQHGHNENQEATAT